MLSFVLICCCAMTNAPFQDSEQPPRFTFDPSTFSVLTPLREEVVRELMQFNDEELASLNAIVKNYDEKFTAFSQLPRDEQNREELRELLSQHTQQVFDVLGKDKMLQLTRYQKGLQTVHFFFDMMSLYAKELALDERQIAVINEQFRKSLVALEKELQDAKYDGRHVVEQIAMLGPTRERLVDEARRAIADKLTQDQRLRLDQLELQADAVLQGGKIFQQPEVVEFLRLSKEQLTRIAQLVEDSKGKGIRQTNSSYLDAAKVLTDDQWARWRELLGTTQPHLEFLLNRD